MSCLDSVLLVFNVRTTLELPDIQIEKCKFRIGADWLKPWFMTITSPNMKNHAMLKLWKRTMYNNSVRLRLDLVFNEQF